MARSRRSARVFAMQVLYGMEMTGNVVGEVIPAVVSSLAPQPEMQAYGMRLVDLVQEHHSELDSILARLSRDWEVDRMAILDRIVLYVAMSELLYSSDVPVKVILQEAIQIAHKYSTENSRAFVNGILDALVKERQMLGNPSSPTQEESQP